MAKQKSKKIKETPVSVKKARQPVSNVRHENRENKMTKLGKSGIYYSDDKVLGQGATATVYEGYFRTAAKKSAVKRVFSEHADISKVELDIWLSIGEDPVSPENINVVQLFSWTRFSEGGSNNYYFAMELAKYSMEQALKQTVLEQDLQWREKCIGWLKDAAAGLQWLHFKRVIHRDLKPDNILIFSVNNSEIAKLTDFGISKKITSVSATGTNSLGKGTSDWMAPEVIDSLANEQPFYTSFRTDIFSFGMTCHYAMTQGKTHPFKKSNGPNRAFITFNIHSESIKPNRLDSKESSSNCLFTWMMMHDPTKRPNIRQVFNHPFFWSAKKQYEFILDFVRPLYEKSSDLQSVIKSLDKKYLQLNPLFNWTNNKFWSSSEFLDNIFKRKTSNAKTPNNKYNGKSIFSLMSLIRDKHAHPGDLVDPLITEAFFGMKNLDGEILYCEDKYAKFFLSHLPNLVMFLFSFLIYSKTQFPNALRSVRSKYKVDEYPKHCVEDNDEHQIFNISVLLGIDDMDLTDDPTYLLNLHMKTSLF